MESRGTREGPESAVLKFRGSFGVCFFVCFFNLRKIYTMKTLLTLKGRISMVIMWVETLQSSASSWLLLLKLGRETFNLLVVFILHWHRRIGQLQLLPPCHIIPPHPSSFVVRCYWHGGTADLCSSIKSPVGSESVSYSHTFLFKARRSRCSLCRRRASWMVCVLNKPWH